MSSTSATAYVVEENIPLPKPKHGCNPGSRRKSRVSLLIAQIEVGQSFFIPEYREFMAAQQAGKWVRPKRFAFRKIEGGWRAWRIE